MLKCPRTGVHVQTMQYGKVRFMNGGNENDKIDEWRLP